MTKPYEAPNLPNRESDWVMFTLQPSEPEGRNYLRYWREFAHLELIEVPVLALEYYFGPDNNLRYYRVAWVDPYHRHFGVIMKGTDYE